jgi:UDP-glucose:(heptosyl)LPS alpha-1,3-glucosyltransferase
MKLAFIIYHYFPFGGLEKNFLNIANACAARGHDVTIYTYNWEGLRPTHFKIIEIAAKGLFNHSRLQSFGQGAIKASAKEKYDAIIGFQRMPGLDFYYCADVCFRNQSAAKYGAWYRLTPRYRTYAAMEKAVFGLQSQTQILLLSTTQQKIYQSYYQTPDARFHLLPPGINRQLARTPQSDSQREVIRQTFHMTDNDTVFLFLGSDYRRKGLVRILKGLKALRDKNQRVYVWVIGDDKSKHFERMIQTMQLKDCVHFLGPQKEVKLYLMGADVLVHPAYFENTGNVLLEAMVAGLPVITTANCGYAYFIEEANAGLVVGEPFVQSALEHAMFASCDLAKRKIWQANALMYSTAQDFYSRAEKAVDIIEKRE